MNKKNVLFVGAFAETGSDGTTGGITLACRSLLAASSSFGVNWILVDSTAPSNLKRSFLQKAVPASGRLCKVIYYLVRRKIDRAVIFAAHGGSFYEKGLMALLCHRFGVPVAFSPRSGYLLTELPASKLQAYFAREVFSNCDVVICQSEYWRNFYLTYTGRPERMAVVQNWIDTDQFVPLQNHARFERITLLYLSWVVFDKGIAELMQATKALVDQGYDFDVLVCGGGDELGFARDFAISNQLENVRFEGWVRGAKKLEYLQRSHIGVLPSYAEGLSNLMLEAMACGLAFISTEVGAAGDVIENGVSGLLIPPRSQVALENAMSKLIDAPNLRESLGEAARARIEDGNSITVGTTRFFELALSGQHCT